MWRRARLYLLCLLCIALPIQGVTAATMALCAPSAGHMQMTGMPMASGNHHHEAEGASSSSRHHAEQKTASHPSDMDSSDGTACSVCASCCIGAAVLSQPILIANVPSATTFTETLGDRAVAYLTEGLERPPRPFLA